jgi:hypothetical protein
MYFIPMFRRVSPTAQTTRSIWPKARKGDLTRILRLNRTQAQGCRPSQLRLPRPCTSQFHLACDRPRVFVHRKLSPEIQEDNIRVILNCRSKYCAGVSFRRSLS